MFGNESHAILDIKVQQNVLSKFTFHKLSDGVKFPKSNFKAVNAKSQTCIHVCLHVFFYFYTIYF